LTGFHEQALRHEFGHRVGHGDAGEAGAARDIRPEAAALFCTRNDTRVRVGSVTPPGCVMFVSKAYEGGAATPQPDGVLRAPGPVPSAQCPVGQKITTYRFGGLVEPATVSAAVGTKVARTG